MNSEGAAQAVISVRNVTKQYGPVTALDGVSLEVYEGETVGLIGANGAGKTTLIESIMGARTPDSGDISVKGFSPQTERRAAAMHMSLQPQGSSLYRFLSVKQTVDLFAAQYPDPLPSADVIEMVDLTKRARRKALALSGGQQQRLRLALALVGNTDVVLLDEPTVGLDPRSREALWDVIRHRAGRGAVVLATQMMDEAEMLCDRVFLFDQGRIITAGTVPELLGHYAYAGGVSFHAAGLVTNEELGDLPGVRWVATRPLGDSTAIRLITDDQDWTRYAVQSSGWRISLYRATAPSLGDVFLSLTGNHPDDLAEEDMESEEDES